MNNLPEDLMYTESHEWIKFTDNGNALIGITYHAQEALSDVVFVNLCDEGDELDKDSSIGDIESIKAVSEIYSPFSGTVVKVNQDALDNPADLNTAPYDTWLIELSGDFDKSILLTPQQYKEFIEQEA